MSDYTEDEYAALAEFGYHREPERTRPAPEVTKMARHWQNADELAEYLGISSRMVRKLMDQGMPSLLIGRARRFDPDACLAWLQERQ